MSLGSSGILGISDLEGPGDSCSSSGGSQQHCLQIHVVMVRFERVQDWIRCFLGSHGISFSSGMCQEPWPPHTTQQLEHEFGKIWPKVRKNPDAHKNKISTSTPPFQKKPPPPAWNEEFYGHGGSSRKNQKCKGTIKSAQPFPAAALRGCTRRGPYSAKGRVSSAF